MLSKNLSRRCFSQSLSGPWNYIAGQRCSPKKELGLMKVTEPATGKILCEVPKTGEEDVARAVEVAKEAFKTWKEIAPRSRGKYLVKAGELIRSNIEDIAKLEVRNSGKPIWEARLDIESCADVLEYFGGICPAMTGQHIPLPGGSFAMVTREPYGVVGGIGAWNYPFQTCVWKAVPALACGNTFIYKPSQFTPVTAPILGEIFQSAGVPDGVFNVIQGEGETGSFLCSHPSVDKLTFTGSVPTGSKVMGAGAEGVKAVTLELGGKSPIIIFDDAHLENAVKGTLLGNFLSQGQVCSNGTRVFVHKNLMEPFLNLLTKQTKQLKLGDPFGEDVTIGATIHETQARKVLDYIDNAKKQGATVVCGGERVQLPGPLSEGWFLSPCILTNVNQSMKVVKEEVFGAVLSLMEFESEEEVVAMANDTPFGLAGAVFTKPLPSGPVLGRNFLKSKNTTSSSAMVKRLFSDIKGFPLTEVNGKRFQLKTISKVNEDFYVDFFLKHFMTREPLGKGMDVATGDSTREKLLGKRVKRWLPSGVSCSIDTYPADEVVGVILCQILTRECPVMFYDTDHEGFSSKVAAMQKILSHVEKSWNVFADPKINRVLGLAVITINPKYANYKLSYPLMQGSEKLGKEHGCQVALGISTNAVSQHLLVRMGYEVCSTVQLKGLKVNGEAVDISVMDGTTKAQVLKKSLVNGVE